MSETNAYDALIAGKGLITDAGTLVSGQNLARGAALGLITASGKLKQLDSSAVDGSAVPFAILAATTNASSADTVCPIYVFGEFNAAALGLVSGQTAASFKAGFRDVGIYLKTTIAA